MGIIGGLFAKTILNAVAPPQRRILASKDTLIEWRSQFKNDGATRFREIDGGLNQLTIRRFESTVERSPFRIHKYSAVPIFGISVLASKPLREFGASIVRYELVKKIAPAVIRFRIRKGF